MRAVLRNSIDQPVPDDVGIFCSFTYQVPPNEERRTTIAFGTRELWEERLLRCWIVVENRLQPSSLRWPGQVVHNGTLIRDATEPVERSRADLEAEYGPLPTPTDEPWSAEGIGYGIKAVDSKSGALTPSANSVKGA